MIGVEQTEARLSRAQTKIVARGHRELSPTVTIKLWFRNQRNFLDFWRGRKKKKKEATFNGATLIVVLFLSPSFYDLFNLQVVVCNPINFFFVVTTRKGSVSNRHNITLKFSVKCLLFNSLTANFRNWVATCLLFRWKRFFFLFRVTRFFFFCEIIINLRHATSSCQLCWKTSIFPLPLDDSWLNCSNGDDGGPCDG